MESRQPPFFTVEKQRRPSPRAASTENATSSSPSYPSGQGSATTPASGGSGSAGDSTGERSRGAAAASLPSPGSTGHHQPRSARATAAADPTTRTPPRRHHHSRDQAHPRSASATRTGGGTLLDTTAFASPTSGLASSMEYGRAMAHLLDSVASPSSTPPRSSSSSPAMAPASARRQPPHAASREQGAQQQQQQLRRQYADLTPATAAPAAASRAAVVGRQPAHTFDLGGRTSPAVSASHRTAAPAAPTYRQPSAFEHADAYTTSTLSGDADTSSQLSSTPVTDRHGSNWASPSEVLQLRALCQDMVARYQRELDQLRGQLRQAQEECAAYARERARVRELQRCYEDGAVAVTQAKAQQSKWEEERALLQLQVEKVVIENQRLQLLLTKKRRLHGQQLPPYAYAPPAAGADSSAARGGGAAAGSRDRVRAAVRAVANANSSRTPSASWPPMPATTANAATLTTTTPTAATITTGTTSNSLTFPHPHGDAGREARLLPSAAAGGGGNPSAPVGRGMSAVTEDDTSPFTHLSPASSASPEAAHFNARLRAASASLTSPSGATATVMVADTPLPLVSSPSTAVTAPSSSSATPARPAAAGASGPLSQPAGPAGEVAEGHTKLPSNLPRWPLGEARREEDPHASSLMTPSLSTSSEALTSRSIGVSAESGTGTASGALAGAARPQRHLMRVGDASQQRADTDEESDENGAGDLTVGEGEFDPSYARGVTDVSSTSAVSSPAPGVMMPATAHNRSRSSDSGSGTGSPSRAGGPGGAVQTQGGHRPGTGQGRTAVAPAAAAASAGTHGISSGPTTDALRGGRTRGAPMATMSGVSPSPGSTVGGSGSSSASSATTTWSLQYLYHLPRTPAEALEEELRLLKELQRLTEENRLLEVRLAQATAMEDMNANQRAQQHLQLTQAHEQARHTAAQWELAARQLESEVSQLQLQCADAQAAVEGVLERAREQQEQQRVRVVELEASCRGALAAAREEAAVKFGALRLSLHEASSAAAMACPSAACGAATAQEVSELRAVAAERQASVVRLQTELHALRGTHAALRDQHAALRAEAQMRHVHVEGELASSRDMLAEAARTQHEADCRIEVLEAEVERLRAGVIASEGCMTAMEERLRLATGELATQQEQLDEAAQWQARAVTAEEDLQTQRRYYEKEISVYKTAACAMQEKHQTAVADLAKRHERLRMRYEAAKVRLATAVSKSGAAALFSGAGKRHTTHAVNGSPTPCPADGEAPVNTSGNSINNAAGGSLVSPSSASPDATATSIVADAVSSRAVSSFDILQALRSSAQATELLTRSLNRATSPYRAV